MKISQLFLAALLGLGFSSAASAQTTVPGAPGSAGMPGSPSSPVTPMTTGATLPGQPGVTTTALPGSAAPVGTAPSTIYGPGAAPTATPGTLRGNRPVGTTAPDATTPARSIRRSASGTRSNTNRATGRP